MYVYVAYVHVEMQLHLQSLTTRELDLSENVSETSPVENAMTFSPVSAQPSSPHGGVRLACWRAALLGN